MSIAKRGFGSMDPDKQRALASAGGKAAHAKGTAHQWTTEEAIAAGRKGGQKSRERAAKGVGARVRELATEEP